MAVGNVTSDLLLQRAINVSCTCLDELPAAFVMESVMDHVASKLDINPILLKERHLLNVGDVSD